jgi:hypothetical protein
VLVTAAAAFWLLAGFNYTPGREATESRYQYIGVVFVLLLLAELLAGWRPRRNALIVTAVVAAAAVTSNLATLFDARDYLRQQTGIARADLAALELAANTESPYFTLTPDVAGTPNLTPVQAGSYLAAVDAHGSPADSPAELAAASEADRARADIVLVHALSVTLARDSQQPASGPPPTPLGPAAGPAGVLGSCVSLPAGVARGAVLRLRTPGALVEPAPGPAATVRLRRFAASFPLSAGGVSGGSTALLDVPPDLSTVRWEIQIQASQPVTVCGASPS